MNVQITDPKEIDRQINEMATELVTLDFKYDSARIQMLKTSIMEKMYAFLQYNKGEEDNVEMFYCPLINKKLSIDEYDVFMSVLLWLLDYNKEKIRWNYVPEKASFITAFRFLLRCRLYEEEKIHRKKTAREIPYDSYLEKLVGDEDDLDENTSTTTNIDDNLCNTALKDTMGYNPLALASLLFDLAKALEHCNLSDENSFKAFFSFDFTKAVKKLICKKDKKAIACIKNNNDCLFSILLIAMLEYLMCGGFESVLDLIENKLRENVDLSRRLNAIEIVLGISHPTASKYSNRYGKLITSIINKE